MLLQRSTALLRLRSPGRLPTPRLLSTRPHPLANKITPRGPVPAGKTPPGLGPKVQRWSTLTAILLATITGTTTYAIGLRSASPPADADTRTYRDPTPADFARAMKEIKEWLPEDCLAQDKETLLDYGHSDWSYHNLKGLPGAVLMPRSTEDVSRIVKIAAKHAIPLIPFSGGTSLEGHCSPPVYDSNPEESEQRAKLAKGETLGLDDVSPGLAFVLSFRENMGEIVKINADDLDIVVQPGISYDAVNAILKEKGIPLFFPVDPCPGAQIGGMVGTSASGTNAVRYGTMRDNVINLTVVLPNGEVIKTRQRAKKSSAAPDLGKLFVGSEGTLGIVVEATLKLHPLLPTTVAVASFPTIQDAADAVRDIVQQGVTVSLFFKFGGTPEQIKSDTARTRAIAQKYNGSKFTFSRNDREADDIWYSRKMALYAAIDYVPGSKCWVTDVCVPISNLPNLVAETREDLDATGIIGPILGHAGDGNFHALLLYKTAEELEKVEGLVHRMVERAQRLDGTCTGEHGVGIGKRDHLEDELGKGTVEVLRAIKKVIDPQNIMNPGKLLPEVGRSSCGH
ncbi:hypothetical protein RQP46_006398 [Phenoliferia psychrophenolica]